MMVRRYKHYGAIEDGVILCVCLLCHKYYCDTANEKIIDRDPE